jgi:hypothetical protein
MLFTRLSSLEVGPERVCEATMESIELGTRLNVVPVFDGKDERLGTVRFKDAEGPSIDPEAAEVWDGKDRRFAVPVIKSPDELRIEPLVVAVTDGNGKRPLVPLFNDPKELKPEPIETEVRDIDDTKLGFPVFTEDWQSCCRFARTPLGHTMAELQVAEHG